MDTEQLRRALAGHRDTLRRLGVESLSVFGSVAAGTASATSDVDLLVRFQGPATFDRYMGLRLWLEDLLGMRIDLVTEKGVRPELSQVVEDAVRVA